MEVEKTNEEKGSSSMSPDRGSLSRALNRNYSSGRMGSTTSYDFFADHSMVSGGILHTSNGKNTSIRRITEAELNNSSPLTKK